MKNKKDLVCLALPSWEGNYVKSTVKIMGELAAYYNILYVDYQYTLKDVVAALLFNKKNLPVLRILGIKSRLRVAVVKSHPINILSLPPVLPVNWIPQKSLFRLGLKINSYIIRRTIRKYIKKLDLKNIRFVNAFCSFYGIFTINKFNEYRHIYYCYDEISAGKWIKNHGKEIEKEFLYKVDKVVVTSKALLASKSKYARSIELVQNGVDFSLFNGGKKEYPVKETIIGYIGSVDDRLDYQLIREVAEKMPDFEFHFIGRIEVNIKGFKLPSNVIFLGPRPYEALPDLVNQFSVSIIPFVKNDFTRNIYPLKINEYLAMGKTVVTTNFSDLSEFEEVCYICHDNKSFYEAILRGIREDNQGIRMKRIKLAESNSWESRAKLFKQCIEND